MKYVRTKDGKILERATFTINHTKYIGSIGNANLYQDNDIVKQADTIEELCDEFVTKEKLVLNKYEYKAFYGHIEYGAIWTDYGLIFVAKMNKKGKLELLEAKHEIQTNT